MEVCAALIVQLKTISTDAGYADVSGVRIVTCNCWALEVFIARFYFVPAPFLDP